MAEKIEIVDGELKLTKTPAATSETITKDAVIGKRAEAQTKVDHLQIDLAEAHTEVDKWDGYLAEMEKQG